MVNLRQTEELRRLLKKWYTRNRHCGWADFEE
jgi:hypothetical protein